MSDKDVAASANQKRMKADPFDVVMRNLGYINADEIQPATDGDDDEDFMRRVPPNCACRPS